MARPQPSLSAKLSRTTGLQWVLVAGSLSALSSFFAISTLCSYFSFLSFYTISTLCSIRTLGTICSLCS